MFTNVEIFLFTAIIALLVALVMNATDTANASERFDALFPVYPVSYILCAAIVLVFLALISFEDHRLASLKLQQQLHVISEIE